jgi:hypothetical protein
MGPTLIEQNTWWFGHRTLVRFVDEIERLREEAWIGDAVLALFVRRWLLTVTGRQMSFAERTALFELFASNRFLSNFGEPTRVEAEIGRLYQSEGLSAALFIEAKFLERFLNTARKRGHRL